MHKRVLYKFNKLDKKFNDDFNISKNQLHYLILNNKFNYIKLTFFGVLSNLILLILSIITIILSKLKNIKIANYFIVHPKSNGNYDNRSKYILDNFDFNKSLNIVRCPAFFDSIKIFFIIPNVVFYMSFDYFNNPFFYKESSILNNYKALHRKEKKNYLIIKAIFKFLKIKKFISIDDQRSIQIFLRVCKELDIVSFGYMHYKFSKYVIGIKYSCFDFFFVWSNFFKKKLIEVNKNYKKKKILISGYSKKRVKSSKSRKISILYLLDLNLNFNEITKLLTQINKCKNLKLILKLKPQDNKDNRWIKFCNEKKIKYYSKENLDYITKIEKIDYFIATISTAILESTLHKAMPIKLITKNDFADDLIKDKVVKKASNYRDILNIVKKKPTKKEINRIFLKVWGKKQYKPKYIKKIISEKIYN